MWYKHVFVCNCKGPFTNYVFIFWHFLPRTSLVCTFYVLNYTFLWPPTHPKCKRNLWKLTNVNSRFDALGVQAPLLCHILLALKTLWKSYHRLFKYVLWYYKKCISDNLVNFLYIASNAVDFVNFNNAID